MHGATIDVSSSRVKVHSLKFTLNWARPFGKDVDFFSKMDVGGNVAVMMLQFRLP